MLECFQILTMIYQILIVLVKLVLMQSELDISNAASDDLNLLNDFKFSPPSQQHPLRSNLLHDVRWAYQA